MDALIYTVECADLDELHSAGNSTHARNVSRVSRTCMRNLRWHSERRYGRCTLDWL